jgi:hypothetical protein
MITRRTTLLLGFSIVLSAAAAFVANSWIQNELNQDASIKDSMEQVIVAQGCRGSERNFTLGRFF